MKMSLRTRIAAAFAAVLVLIGVVGVTAYHNANATIGDIASVREAR